MRKSLILVSLLLVLSAGLIVSAFASLDEKKDAVSITETVLSGDSSAAEGIAITNKTSYGSHLFWDTSFLPGTREAPKTTFRFSQQRLNETGDEQATMYLSYNLDYSMGGNDINLDDEDEQRGMMIRPAIDVASRTEPGETHSEVLRLRDYYEYYQVTAEIYSPSVIIAPGADTQSDLQEKISQYFQIPVLEDHKIRLAVTKGQNGNITDVNCQSISGGNWLYSECVVTDSGAYCAVTFVDSETGAPLQLPKKLSGIHFLPFEKDEEQDGLRPVVDEMKLVYPLDEADAVRLLNQPSEKDKLMLFTQRDGAFFLSVIDKEAMTLNQRMELHNTSGDVGICDMQYLDDSLIVIFTDGEFRLLTPRGGVYEPALHGNFYDCGLDETVFFLSDMTLAYDGNRLAAAFYQEPYRCSGFYLLVCDQDGFSFTGRYDQSADRTVPDSGDLPTPLYGNGKESLSILM